MRIRTLVKDTLIYGSGTVLLRATAFLTVPIYTRVFTPSDYGIWNFVTTSVWLLNGFLILGGDSALAWLYFRAKSDRERRVLTSTLLAFLGVWGLGIVLVLIPFAGAFSEWSFGTPSYAAMFQIALLAAPFVLANAMASQALRNMFRSGTASILNIAGATVELTTSFYFLFVQDSGIKAPLIGVFVGAVTLLPVRLWLIRPLLGRVFSLDVLTKALRFGVPLVPASVSMWVLLASDRIVLAKLASPSELGLYSVALGVASLIMLADSAFGQAWFPYAAQLHAE
jgi:O-antigen/teichoic acid export membrane protein